MNTIFDVRDKCRCYDCMRDVPFHPDYCDIIQRILPTDPAERCRFIQKLYFLKPFTSNSWTKDWKSTAHRDFTFRDDLWSPDVPPPKDYVCKRFEDYVCKRWCEGTHMKPLPAKAYSAETMPNLFEEPHKAIYSDPRKCSSTYCHDFTWKKDYRPRGKFPGWCLKGHPPEFLDEDRTQ